MESKSNLRPIFQKHIWFLSITGIIFFIISPILFPIAYIVMNWEGICEDIGSFYSEISDAIFMRYK